MTNHHFRVCAYCSYIISRTCSYAIASPTDEVSFKAALHESPERTLAPRSACKPWHMCTLNPATFQPAARCGCTPRRADARVLSLHLEGDAGARRGLIFFSTSHPLSLKNISRDRVEIDVCPRAYNHKCTISGGRWTRQLSLRSREWLWTWEWHFAKQGACTFVNFRNTLKHASFLICVKKMKKIVTQLCLNEYKNTTYCTYKTWEGEYKKKTSCTTLSETQLTSAGSNLPINRRYNAGEEKTKFQRRINTRSPTPSGQTIPAQRLHTWTGQNERRTLNLRLFLPLH